MQFEILETERLKLRKLTPEVFDFVFNTFSDDEIKRFLNYDSDNALSKERKRFEAGLSTYNKSFLYFQIIDNASDKIIGWCGFHTWYTDHCRAEIGYVLTNDDFKQRGIMTETLNSIIRYGFEIMGLNRIEAFVGYGNIASLKLMKKFGFIQEGILREHYRINDVIEDSILFSLLKRDFY